MIDLERLRQRKLVQWAVAFLAAREPYLVDLPVDPLFQKPLGKDPRMQRLIARIGPR